MVLAAFLEAYGFVLFLFVICSVIMKTDTVQFRENKENEEKSLPGVQHTKQYCLTSSRLIHKIKSIDRETSFKNNSSVLEHLFTNLF